MNVKLLKEVRQAILEHPDQFCMETWFSVVNIKARPAGGCGTAACIGGWALYLSQRRRKGFKTVEDAYLDFADTVGPEPYLRPGHLLKLDCPHSRLFNMYEWPLNFRKAIEAAPTTGAAAKVAAKRIDFFIKTKGTDTE